MTDTFRKELTQPAELAHCPSRVMALDVRAWSIWLVILLAVALLNRNPFYQGLIAFWILITWPAGKSSTGFGLRGVAVFTAIALTFSTLFNALTVHTGETVLFSIPGELPLVSGNITLEAASYGASSGLTISLIILIVARFSMAVDYASLLRRVPAIFFELGLIVSIGFTLVPAMVRAWHDIRQSQALRGHQVSGVRDLPPLLVPLFVSGLERALSLAEAMEARGYARRGVRTIPTVVSLSMVMALLLALSLVLTNTFLGLEGPLFLGGLVLAGFLFWLAFRHLQQNSPRSSYRHGTWTWRENLTCLAILIFLGAFLLADGMLLSFSPYPRLDWPAFEPWLALATLGPAVPLLMSPAHD
jgi:energy-coupling factor transport system permease protein